MQKIVTRYGFMRMAWMAAATVFVVSLLVYILTAEPTVSFWDCPEYVTTAARLEPGHPPGNPVWMLVARMFTMFATDASSQAFAVNVMSGVCSALAVMYLSLTVSVMCRNLLMRRRQPFRRRDALVSLTAGTVGSLTLAFSDTFWFSAVEAEVYAFSALMTALMVWLAQCCGENRGRPKAKRYIILMAYLSGLSIGIHQLNLLTLPAIALILVFYRYNSLAKKDIVIALAGSVAIIASVLFGMMPGAIRMAQIFELTCVNSLSMGVSSGVLIYLALTFATLVSAVFLSRSGRVTASMVVGCIGLFLSGAASFGANLVVGAVLSAVICVGLLYERRRIRPEWFGTGVWSLALLMLGYCSFALIMVRAAANPPMNQGNPSDIFAFESYLMREQYGSTPLLKGPTPNSYPLRSEEIAYDSAGSPMAVYPDYYRESTNPRYTLLHDGEGRGRYEVFSYGEKLRYPPELDMWLPRISYGNDMSLYDGWADMSPENMVEVEASYAVDSLGNAVGRLDPKTGKRSGEKKMRPSYLQNLQILLGYQTSYMYMRYLMWNFVGRQNEYYAQGEADAGNFISGIPLIDDLMLENPSGAVAERGDENPGHRGFFFIPLLFGILGMTFQLTSRIRGKRQFTVVMLLFLLTGVAIVLYLNQAPGQPRERDYSFVGSFYAFCIWIGLGAAWVVQQFVASRRFSRLSQWVALLMLGLPAWMFAENLPDHDRSGRTAARDIAANILVPLEHDALLFTNGDNYTFPLWYLQDVEGVRRDVRTINLAYLTTPWYISQLGAETDGGKPVPMILPDSMRNDVSDRRLRINRYTPGNADAVEALTSYYRGEIKELPEALRLAPAPGCKDSLVISVRKAAGGSRSLRRDKLMMVDIIAANAAQGWKRKVYWSSVLGLGNMVSLNPRLMRYGLTYRLDPELPDEYRVPLDVDGSYDALTGVMSFGGFDEGRGVYADEPSRRMVTDMRRIIFLTADSLLARGDAAKAVQLAEISRTRLADESAPYAVTLDGVQVRYEGVDLADIYLRASKMTGNEAWRQTGLALLRREVERAARNYRYVQSLSPRYRNYTMLETRLQRQTFYTPLLSWEEAGGSAADFGSLLEGIDLRAEKRATQMEHLRRWLIANARDAARWRRGSADFKLFRDNLRLFYEMGGERSTLETQAEFESFPFTRYLPG